MEVRGDVVAGCIVGIAIGTLLGGIIVYVIIHPTKMTEFTRDSEGRIIGVIEKTL